MPRVMTGPDLISFRVLTKEQGVVNTYDTVVLLTGYSPNWTGLDKPHFIKKKYRNSRSSKLKFFKPVMSDLLEVYDYKRRKKWIARKSGVDVDWPMDKTCGYAWQRSSGAISSVCIDKNLKEISNE
jgi:hypothetical protein